MSMLPTPRFGTTLAGGGRNVKRQWGVDKKRVNRITPDRRVSGWAPEGLIERGLGRLRRLWASSANCPLLPHLPKRLENAKLCSSDWVVRRCSGAGPPPFEGISKLGGRGFRRAALGKGRPGRMAWWPEVARSFALVMTAGGRWF